MFGIGELEKSIRQLDANWYSQSLTIKGLSEVIKRTEQNVNTTRMESAVGIDELNEKIDALCDYFGLELNPIDISGYEVSETNVED